MVFDMMANHFKITLTIRSYVASLLMQIIHGALAVVMKHQYAKAWPHSDITSCCHRSLHAFTSRFDSPRKAFLHCRCFCMSIYIHI